MKKLLLILSFLMAIPIYKLVAQSDHEQKKPLIKKYLDLAIEKERQGDKKEASRFLNEVAMIEWEQLNYNRAIEYFQQSLKLNEAISNTTGIMAINNNLGMIYNDAHEYEKALQYFQNTLNVRRQSGEKIGIIASLINTSVVLNNLKKYNDAAKYLSEALQYAQEMNDIKQMRSCYGMLSETYEKAGNQQKASEYFELYRTFHELIIKEKERKYKDTIRETKTENIILESEKRAKERELAFENRLLDEKESKIKILDKRTQMLLDTANRQQLAIAYLEKEVEIKIKDARIKDLLIQEEASEIQNNRIIIYYLLIAFGLSVLVIFLVWLNGYQRKIANQKLNKQKQALEESNQIKDKLFSVIAHDLRSPFNSLIGLLALLDADLLTKEEQETIFKSLKFTTFSTLETLDALLQWSMSQMKGDKLETITENIDLYNITESQINFYRQQASNKKIDLLNQIKIDTFAMADQNQIGTVIRNLIGNALKFTPENGKIIITQTESESFWKISIKDTGIGISQENLAKLFKNESHFTTRGTANEKGTGLGLLLCKEFAENNKGKISVESTLGEGTIFSFTIPKA